VRRLYQIALPVAKSRLPPPRPTRYPYFSGAVLAAFHEAAQHSVHATLSARPSRLKKSCIQLNLPASMTVDTLGNFVLDSQADQE
jgi:hypothetical protein